MFLKMIQYMSSKYIIVKCLISFFHDFFHINVTQNYSEADNFSSGKLLHESVIITSKTNIAKYSLHVTFYETNIFLKIPVIMSPKKIIQCLPGMSQVCASLCPSYWRTKILLITINESVDVCQSHLVQYKYC